MPGLVNLVATGRARSWKDDLAWFVAGLWTMLAFYLVVSWLL